MKKLSLLVEQLEKQRKRKCSIKLTLDISREIRNNVQIFDQAKSFVLLNHKRTICKFYQITFYAQLMRSNKPRTNSISALLDRSTMSLSIMIIWYRTCAAQHGVALTQGNFLEKSLKWKTYSKHFQCSKRPETQKVRNRTMQCVASVFKIKVSSDLTSKNKVTHMFNLKMRVDTIQTLTA